MIEHLETQAKTKAQVKAQSEEDKEEQRKEERGDIKQEEKNNLLIILNYFLDKDGILYSPSLRIYFAIILGFSVFFNTSCG